jgi:hypothetical protein
MLKGRVRAHEPFDDTSARLAMARSGLLVVLVKPIADSVNRLDPPRANYPDEIAS